MAAKSSFHPGSSDEKSCEMCGAIYASDVLTVQQHVYIPTKCSRTLCIDPGAVSDVSEALLSLRSVRSFQGNMCAGILPQLRQGLAGFTVGTGRVWERGGSVPLSFPHSHSASFSVAVVHQAAPSLPSPPSFSPLLYVFLLPFSPYNIFYTLFSSSH